ncbi:MAG: response regulator, partial [Betaproteobacteria bacterium]|nr:response regulator [Betaproteobacteria bacterium]
VTGVSDGQAALHAVLQADAQGDAFGLLLMDIQMPGMDGLQATQALRLTHPSSLLPVIALTAGALQSERDAALQAGMDDFVTKPVDRAHLLACVRRHVPRPPDQAVGSVSLEV